MISKRTIATLIMGAVGSTSALGLDFTPYRVFTAEEGPPVSRYYFQDHDKRLAFRVDKKMTVAGSSSAVTFDFQDLRSGSMRLCKSQLMPERRFDDKTGETYRALARSLLPSQATNVQLLSEIAGAIRINGWTSQQYKFFYTFADVSYSRSITFINFSPQEQIVFDVAAPPADFAKIYARSYRVLNSITEMVAFARDGHS